jgi:uncharacterized protein YcbK (DUF882 family)
VTRAALAAALVLVLVAAARPAAARPLIEKSAKATTAAARKKLDKQLARRIGKPPAKLINVYNPRTKEWLAVEADAKATVEGPVLNEFLRCHFTNQRATMDPRVITVIVSAALHFGVDQIFIVSGYRSPKYNLQLRKKGHEVARESQHTEGTAVDFRLPGVTPAALRDFVKRLRFGGVGFYPESGFVHADTGTIRFWTGR